ncbi:DUF1642 domain-containing protein [Lactococcus lactis]|uniref:DUF1642 domain-containing protein n=1 Tax=Lactococcus lactis TaxID=1358 RepID=UPI00288DDBF1|nr:DUF1642 domain-containing protein [Lactococcus lactis]MDT2901635.1 DUF1642 domain-containing protein [Lactococcus lactis]
MTKFEEEFKALTSWDWINVDTIQQILKRFGNWHSDEEFKELLDKYNNLNNLKLQQQALPVVPEDVDKAIKYLKTQNNFATFADFDDILTEKGLRWLNDFQFKDRRFGFGGLNNKLFILSHLAITGYKVEKPQLEDDVSIARDKCSSITAKKYIEHAIGTIKHDGHLGNIQTECILPYLEKALAAIGGHEK